MTFLYAGTTTKIWAEIANNGGELGLTSIRDAAITCGIEDMEEDSSSPGTVTTILVAFDLDELIIAQEMGNITISPDHGWLKVAKQKYGRDFSWRECLQSCKSLQISGLYLDLVKSKHLGINSHGY